LTSLVNISPSRQRKSHSISAGSNTTFQQFQQQTNQTNQTNQINTSTVPKFQLVRSSTQHQPYVTHPIIQRMSKLSVKDPQTRAVEELITTEIIYLENIQSLRKVERKREIERE